MFFYFYRLKNYQIFLLLLIKKFLTIINNINNLLKKILIFNI